MNACGYECMNVYFNMVCINRCVCVRAYMHMCSCVLFIYIHIKYKRERIVRAPSYTLSPVRNIYTFFFNLISSPKNSLFFIVFFIIYK